MKKSRVLTQLFLILFLAILLPAVFFATPVYSESIARLKTDDEEMRRTMVQISRQLGVNCTTCHNSKNFSSSEKIEFKVARDHMRITQMLIDNGMNGKDKRPKADCFMCHRGKLMPDYKEPFDPMTMEKEKIKVPVEAEEAKE